MSKGAERLEELYHLALGKPKEERSAFLEEVCGGDKAMHQELRSMLDALEKAGSFLEAPALELAVQKARQAGSQLMIGHRLGPYQIGPLLGRGGMGEVYSAHDTRLDRKVALKVLPVELIQNPDRLKRFVREAKTASALNHPNIATIHDIGEAEGIHFLIMEYVEGETLAARIQKGALEIQEILNFGIQVAEALEEAHGKGIIHRDIKPANLMLTAKGRVKVLDFGLAKKNLVGLVSPEMETESWAETASGVLMGTIDYMSPEQLLGEEVDARTDLFSLGVTFFQLATGALPFHAETPTKTMDRILHGKPEATSRQNGNLPGELEQIILKCLEKDRDERYQTATELLADLRQLQQAGSHAEGLSQRRGILTWLPHATLRPLTWPQHGFQNAKHWLYILGVVCLVLTAGVVYLVRSKSSPPGPKIKSLAVLPLANLSRDPAQEYFSDGITDLLISELGQTLSIPVISRQTMMQYKSTHKKLPEIAQEINVDGIVEGSVLRDNQQIRITVQLIHAPTDRHLWARNFQREIRGILELQGEIAQTVAHEIQAQINPAQQKRSATPRTIDPEAFEFFLKGRKLLFDQFTAGSISQAIECFTQVIKKEPRFIQAYLELAGAYSGLEQMGSQSNAFQRERKECLSKAIEMDPESAEAHYAMARLKGENEWDWNGARREYDRALELNPNLVSVYFEYPILLNQLGKYREALTLSRKGYQLDPLSPFTAVCVVYRAYYGRFYEEALKESELILEKFPNYWNNYWVRGLNYLAMNQPEKAIPELERAKELQGKDSLEVWPDLSTAYFRAGKKTEAGRILAQLNAEGKRRALPYSLWARLYSGWGDRDKAFEYWEKSYQAREKWVTWIGLGPLFDSIRPDPRFAELLRRIGLPDAGYEIP